jgi:hypothetical protein
MMNWKPAKNDPLRPLYDNCMSMGARRFSSPADMEEWIAANWDSVAAYLRNKFHLVIKPLQYHFEYVVAVIREIHFHGTKGLSEELKRLVVKALNTPLLLNPRSLHPNKFNTLLIQGV